MTQSKPIGLTKDGTWQFGLSKSFDLPLEAVWDFMFSREGLNIWLPGLTEDLEIKKVYTTREGVELLIRVFTPYSHIRMSWKKKTWINTSSVQVRVTGNQKKSTITFAHEKLLNNKQREDVKTYWNEKMHKIERGLQT